MLFSVGGLLSGYEGVQKIIHPGHVETPAVAFGVLGVAICLEGFSLRTAVRNARAGRGEQSWREFIRRAKAPELPVVLLEDSAALTGLLFALAGVSLAVATGNDAWDGAGSLAIGVLLAIVAAVLAVEMKSLLIGEAASAETQRAIVAALEAGPEVDRVIHLRTVHISPESLLVAAKIAVPPESTAAQIVAGINAAERRVRAAVPLDAVIYLEPDLYRPDLADVTDPAIRSAQQHPGQPG
jgi:divalent metal cation (Fe/Co/Zn/Cd) transporter